MSKLCDSLLMKQYEKSNTKLSVYTRKRTRTRETFLFQQLYKKVIFLYLDIVIFDIYTALIKKRTFGKESNEEELSSLPKVLWPSQLPT